MNTFLKSFIFCMFLTGRLFSATQFIESPMSMQNMHSVQRNLNVLRKKYQMMGCMIFGNLNLPQVISMEFIKKNFMPPELDVKKPIKHVAQSIVAHAVAQSILLLEERQAAKKLWNESPLISEFSDLRFYQSALDVLDDVEFFVKVLKSFCDYWIKAIALTQVAIDKKNRYIQAIKEAFDIYCDGAIKSNQDRIILSLCCDEKLKNASMYELALYLIDLRSIEADDICGSIEKQVHLLVKQLQLGKSDFFKQIIPQKVCYFVYPEVVYLIEKNKKQENKALQNMIKINIDKQPPVKKVYHPSEQFLFLVEWLLSRQLASNSFVYALPRAQQ